MNVECNIALPKGWEASHIGFLKKGDFFFGAPHPLCVEKADYEDVVSHRHTPVLILKKKKKKRWTPAEKENFYYVNSTGEVEEYKYCESYVGQFVKKLHAVGNVFATKTEAEAFAKHLKKASEEFFNIVEP